MEPGFCADIQVTFQWEQRKGNVIVGTMYLMGGNFISHGEMVAEALSQAHDYCRRHGGHFRRIIEIRPVAAAESLIGEPIL